MIDTPTRAAEAVANAVTNAVANVATKSFDKNGWVATDAAVASVVANS